MKGKKAGGHGGHGHGAEDMQTWLVTLVVALAAIVLALYVGQGVLAAGEGVKTFFDREPTLSSPSRHP
jgi:hypothetical protein